MSKKSSALKNSKASDLKNSALEFEILGLPKILANARMHWSVKAKENEKWKRLVCKAVLNEQERAARQFKKLTRAKVTITRFSSTEPDFDNLVSAGKSLLDGLKEAGVILDDKVSVIGQPVFLWEKCKPKEGKIKIKVEAA